MSPQLKVRIETAGVTHEEAARILRDVARRIDDGRMHGLIEGKQGRAIGAWAFEDEPNEKKMAGSSLSHPIRPASIKQCRSESPRRSRRLRFA